jgi:ornithine decarboxylase
METSETPGRAWAELGGGEAKWLTDNVRARAEELAGSEASVLLIDASQGGDVADALEKRLGSVYYAVKAGPYEPLIAELAKRGHGMDIASVPEARLALTYVDPNKVICTNPVLPLSQLSEIVGMGVSVFVIDDIGQARVLKEAAGSLGVQTSLHVLVRVGWHDASAAIALAEKFGVGDDEVPALVAGLRSLGLHVAGLSFHLGSQAQSLDTATEASASALVLAEACGIDGPLIDVGGGFPVGYVGAVTTWEQFADALAAPLRDKALVLCEPGRVISSAGTWLVTSVIGVAARRGRRFVHVNAGAYHGLLEASTLSNSSLVPPCALWAEPGELVPVRLTGPTCDSADMIFPYEVLVSENVKAGDVLVFYLAGAYSTTCSTTFNGFSGPVLEEISA